MKPNLDALRSLAATLEDLPRLVDASSVELRAAPEGSQSPGGVRYYPVVYNKLSLDLGGWRERIAPGAFDESLDEDDIRAMVNHDRAKVIARRSIAEGIDTLRISSDDTGVLFEIDELPNTTVAKDLVEDLRCKNITGASMWFRVVEDTWDWEGDADDGIYVRTVLKARLREGSPVSFPAYPDTLAEVRDLLGALAEIRSADGARVGNRTAIENSIRSLQALLDGDEPAPDVRSDEPTDTDGWLASARNRTRMHELAETTNT